MWRTLTLLVLLSACGAASAGDVVLAWDYPPAPDPGGWEQSDPRIVGYEIHYGTAPGAYFGVLYVDGVYTTTATVQSLTTGTWHFAARSVGLNGEHSAFSNEVFTDVTDGGGPVIPLDPIDGWLIYY